MPLRKRVSLRLLRHIRRRDLYVQYQKVLSHDDIPIVRTAYRTSQTAVASIPRLALSGLLDPDCLFAVCASNAIASGLRNGIGIVRWPFTRGAVSPLNPTLRRTIVLPSGRNVKWEKREKEQEISTDDKSSSERLQHYPCIVCCQ